MIILFFLLNSPFIYFSWKFISSRTTVITMSAKPDLYHFFFREDSWSPKGMANDKTELLGFCLRVYICCLDE